MGVPSGWPRSPRPGCQDSWQAPAALRTPGGQSLGRGLIPRRPPSTHSYSLGKPPLAIKCQAAQLSTTGSSCLADSARGIHKQARMEEGWLTRRPPAIPRRGPRGPTCFPGGGRAARGEAEGEASELAAPWSPPPPGLSSRPLEAPPGADPPAAATHTAARRRTRATPPPAPGSPEGPVGPQPPPRPPRAGTFLLGLHGVLTETQTDPGFRARLLG